MPRVLRSEEFAIRAAQRSFSWRMANSQWAGGVKASPENELREVATPTNAQRAGRVGSSNCVGAACSRDSTAFTHRTQPYHFFLSFMDPVAHASNFPPRSPLLLCVVLTGSLWFPVITIPRSFCSFFGLPPFWSAFCSLWGDFIPPGPLCTSMSLNVILCSGILFHVTLCFFLAFNVLLCLIAFYDTVCILSTPYKILFFLYGRTLLAAEK